MKKDILNDNFTIYNADCFDIMDNLKNKGIEFDLILTDPPYGKMKDSVILKSSEWDIKLDTGKMFRLAADLIRENGRCLLFSISEYTTELRSNHPADLYYTQSAIWLKNKLPNFLSCNKSLLGGFEDITLYKKKYDNYKSPVREYARQILKFIGLKYAELEKILKHRKVEHFFSTETIQFSLPSEKAYNELIKKFNIDKMEGFLTFQELKKFYKAHVKKASFNLNEKTQKSNVFAYPKDPVNYHSTQKPVNLLKDLILTFTNENDFILDFTMGSGSTGVACAQTNRRFIGIELNKDFYNIAKERILKELENK